MNTVYNPSLVANYDVSSSREVSLEKIASEFYNREYQVVYEGGEPDSWYVFSFLDAADIAKESDYRVLQIHEWLRLPKDAKGVYYPEAGLIIADLIVHGQLPYGSYMLFV